MFMPLENIAEKAKTAFFANVIMTGKAEKPLKVKAFSAKGFPMVTYGDFENNVDLKGYWINYITERFKGLSFVQGTRYYSVFSRQNRYSGKFVFVVVIMGRTEIYTAKNLYEIKALVKSAHLGRNRAITRNNPQSVDLTSLSFTSYHRKGQVRVYKCKVKKLGNMPKSFVLWR